MSKAAELKKALKPLAADGNPYACVALLRLEWSKDPEAAAERILEDYATVARAVSAIGQQLLDALGPRLERILGRPTADIGEEP